MADSSPGTATADGGIRAVMQSQPRWLLWAAIIVVAILVIAVVVMGVGWNTALAERADPAACVLAPGWDLEQASSQLHQEVADGECGVAMREALRAGLANPDALRAIRTHRNTATGMYVTQIAMAERPVVAKAKPAPAASGGGLSLQGVLDKHQPQRPKVRFEHAPPAPGTLAAQSLAGGGGPPSDDDDGDDGDDDYNEPPPLKQQRPAPSSGGGRLGGASRLPAIGSLPGAGGRKAPGRKGLGGGGGMTLSGVNIEMHKDPAG